MTRPAAVVVGIGNGMRTDDGLGPAVVTALRARPLPGCDVVRLDGESTRLIETWRDRDLAVICDAIRLGAAPGTIHDLTIDDIEGIPSQVAASSHVAGLAEACALGQALRRMPRRLRVMGIEPADTGFGDQLTSAVHQSLGSLVARIAAAVTEKPRVV